MSGAPAIPSGASGTAGDPPRGVLSRTTRTLHWTAAAAILLMLAYGFWLQTLPGGPSKGPAVQIHKSFGMLMFCLALARLAWRMREGFPPPLAGTDAWERRGARAMHGLLLAATILMPVSGILRSLAYARPVSVFGVPVIPQVFAAKQDTLYALSSSLHDWLAIALTAAIALHAAAALKHHWIDRDPTLDRMLGRRGVSR
jgi:cytochrome b561